jgi:acetyl esterase/lipase
VTLFLLLALAPVARAQDDFYAPPGNLASRPNGTILKQRAVDIPVPLVTATQIQYRSTDALGTPIAAVTTLIVPQADYDGTRPLVSYQMAYDSLAPQCTPSQTIPAGTQSELPALEPLLQFGFAVAVPDYEGPNNAFAAGPLAGHTVLDGIRAARMLLSGRATPTALFGYSAGGQAAAWAAELQPVYAPDVTIAGVAAGGVPVDLEQLVRASGGTDLAGVGALALFGVERQYNRFYLDGLLSDRGKAEKAEAGSACGRDFVLAHAGEHFGDLLNIPTSDPFRIPRIQRIIQQNRLGDLTPPMPVYLFHTTGDELVPVTGPDAVARRWCRGGTPVFYQRDEGGDHVGYPSTAGFPAYLWIAGRFTGAEVPNNCGTTPRGVIGSYCAHGHSTKFRLDRIRGEKIIRVVVRLRGIAYKRKGGEALRRVVIRGLPPGMYRFTVTRYSRDEQRTRAYRRRILCGDQ